jgi:hypothetical protein
VCVKKYVHVASSPEAYSKFHVIATSLQFIPSTTSFKGQWMFSKSRRQCSMCMRAYYKQRFLSRYFPMEETKKITDTLKFHSELIKRVVRDFTIACFEKEYLI